MGKLSKLAGQCLTNLFFGKILSLEETDVKGAFSKQAQLDALHTEIEVFIQTNPRAVFQIKITDDEINDTVTLIINNAPENEIRNNFIIEIDPDWSGFTVNQLSIDGKNKINVKIFTL